MWSKAFEEAFGNKVFHYGKRIIKVRDLNLGSDYLGYFCRQVARERDWRIDGITYEWIRSLRCIGEKKARAIAEALIACGVEIADIPEETHPTKLTVVGSAAAECSSCHAILTTNMDAGQRLYKYCPMCGKKFKW